jgi:hypothetical protein
MSQPYHSPQSQSTLDEVALAVVNCAADDGSVTIGGVAASLGASDHSARCGLSMPGLADMVESISPEVGRLFREWQVMAAEKRRRKAAEPAQTARKRRTPGSAARSDLEEERPPLLSVAAREYALARGLPLPEDFCGQPPVPEAATRAEPGSEDKIAVMATRYERREQLHHPGDVRLPRPSTARRTLLSDRLGI